MTPPYLVESAEFWTSKQRAGHSLHEISYRACFKPQLPAFFINQFTSPGDLVFDPFMGRGTTPIEAALQGRLSAGSDGNPLCTMLTAARLQPPSLENIKARLNKIDWKRSVAISEDLLVFYHPETLQKICVLREEFGSNLLDPVDDWIRMVVLNRLSGHSSGYFSVRTMPPNQAVGIETQRQINIRFGQIPEPRDVPAIILKKTGSLIRKCTVEERRYLIQTQMQHQFWCGCATDTYPLADNSVSLVVTSPPFLNVVNYAKENWLRCWFVKIAPETLPTITSSLKIWSDQMLKTLRQIYRVLKPGGHVAFEVGEVKKGNIRLEETVIPAGIQAGLTPKKIFINTQQFTKTSHCWGIKNNLFGTNTNRIVLFQK
jgi:hypothetical protein